MEQRQRHIPFPLNQDQCADKQGAASLTLLTLLPQLVPKVVSCLQTVGNTISLTSVSRGVFYGPGHQHTRDVVLIQW